MAKFNLSPSFRRFFKAEAGAGVLLFLSTLTALFVANGPLAPGYFRALAQPLGPLSLQHWINDGLMAIFFFVVGLEIKRELAEGELASVKRAALPIAATLGGMAGPALLYLAITRGGPASGGWAIPTATDIAFAAAALSLYGRRVPPALKIFLLALAIVDDLGAVIVIAVFYPASISLIYLLLAVLLSGAVGLALKFQVHRASLYLLLGALIWGATLRSGVHATIAGVLLGFFTPLTLPARGAGGAPSRPLTTLLHGLHPWVSFLIMPFFALANAGIPLPEGSWAGLTGDPVFRGVGAGLLLGKPLGILAGAALAVKLKLAAMPSETNWPALAGVAALGGIGFTMALFIANLSLPPELALGAKAAILAGSAAAAGLGLAILAVTLPRR